MITNEAILKKIRSMSDEIFSSLLLSLPIELQKDFKDIRQMPVTQKVIQKKKNNERPLSDDTWSNSVKKAGVTLKETSEFGFIAYSISFNRVSSIVSPIHKLYEDQKFPYLKKCVKKLNSDLNVIIDWDANHSKPNLPYEIADAMISEIPKAFDTVYWVFFDIEFVLSLIYTHNIPKENIVFFSDNIAKTNLVRSSHIKVASYLININDIIEGKYIMPKSNNIAVIGNPPYNANSNSKNSTPLYNLFIESIIDNIKPNYLSMIVPSRWMIGGKGLDSFRKRMQTDRHIKTITDFQSSDVFAGAEIAGGVNYFLWDKNYNGPCNFNGYERFLDSEDTIIRDTISIGILEKIKNKTKTYLSSICSVRNPFGISTTYEPKDNGVVCYFNQKIGYKYVSALDINDKTNSMDKWKIAVPFAPIAGQTDFTKPISIFRDSNIVILKPNTICSETYLVIKTFDNINEANIFSAYIKSKLFRFMLSLKVISQNITRECYSWVPDLNDYTNVLTDEDLYVKFNLTTEEISHINSKIKD